MFLYMLSFSFSCSCLFLPPSPSLYARTSCTCGVIPMILACSAFGRAVAGSRRLIGINRRYCSWNHRLPSSYAVIQGRFGTHSYCSVSPGPVKYFLVLLVFVCPFQVLRTIFCSIHSPSSPLRHSSRLLGKRHACWRPTLD